MRPMKTATTITLCPYEVVLVLLVIWMRRIRAGNKPRMEASHMIWDEVNDDFNTSSVCRRHKGLKVLHCPVRRAYRVVVLNIVAVRILSPRIVRTIPNIRCGEGWVDRHQPYARYPNIREVAQARLRTAKISDSVPVRVLKRLHEYFVENEVGVRVRLTVQVRSR